MRRTLYRKLILIYVILAIAGFTLISTVGSRMVEDSLVSSASTSLYREATQIASKQGDLYYHSERSLTDLYNSLSALASYHNSQIWLISADGEILLNTAAALDEENPEIIDGFDPVARAFRDILQADAQCKGQRPADGLRLTLQGQRRRKSHDSIVSLPNIRSALLYLSDITSSLSTSSHN